LAAEALISGIESNNEFLIAGIRIFMYGSKSYGSYVRMQIFPINLEASYFDMLSCIISPLSRIGTRRERLGASIAWTKLVSSRTFKASFRYTFGLLNALTKVSRISEISGHLITDPMF
jgi:hypothetical protein